MSKIIRQQPEATFDEAYVSKLVNEFQNHKSMLDATQKRLDGFKKELTEILDAHGKPDDKGNLWINLPSCEIKRERRISKTFNASAAEAWAKENGFWDSVKEVIETINEGLLLGLAWDNDEIQEKVKSFYVEKETWALKV
jgi:hypothetical protein